MYSQRYLTEIVDQAAQDDGELLLGFTFSANGHYLLSYSETGRVLLWDIRRPKNISLLREKYTQAQQNGQIVFSLSGHNCKLSPQVVCPKPGAGLPKALVASYNKQRQLCIWDITAVSDAPYLTTQFTEQEIVKFEFSADGSKLVIVTENNLVDIYNLAKKIKLASFNCNQHVMPIQKKSIISCQFSLDSQHLLLAFCYLSRPYFIFQQSDHWRPHAIGRLTLASSLSYCTFSPSRKKILVADNNIIRICENTAPWFTISIFTFTHPIKQCIFSADENTILVSGERFLAVHLTAPGHCLFQIEEAEAIISIDISPHNHAFIVMLSSGIVKQYCMQTGQLIVKIIDPILEGEDGPQGNCVKFSPDGTTILTLVDASCVNCWDAHLTSILRKKHQINGTMKW
jgi:WD40 repeat protein